jgi:hypothetical protein
MLDSPAWRALTPAAKAVLERLEMEYMRDKAGRANGGLVCTYEQFVDHGIRLGSIAGGIRQAIELGFLKITQRGRAYAGAHHPNYYRLTYLPTAHAKPTDEWRNSKARRT